MSSQLDFAALEDCLKTLNHLYIDINRLIAEAGYETKRGGYGEVQVSRLDSGTAGSKLVAAKRIYLKARHKEHERLAFRLARELKVWASLHHPHVLPVVGYYLDKDRRIAVLMSEYMAHGDLKDYIEQEKPSWDARLYLIRDTTAGLAYLHGHDPSIRHGDLKAGNVLINAERRAVLADFGLSRTLEEGPTGLTTSDGLKGTLRYYSPEIVAETADCHSLPSDIWAWACLVLEVLADIIPYAGKKSEHSIIKALMNNEPPSDTTSLPIPVPAVKHLLARCWTIQPNERPSVDHCLAIIDTELSTLQMTPGVGRDSDEGSYPQLSNFDENYSFNRPHEDGGWPPAMGPQVGPNPTAIQNRRGTTQGPEDGLAAQHGLSWSPANLTPPLAQRLDPDGLRTIQRQQQQQQSQQQGPQQPPDGNEGRGIPDYWQIPQRTPRMGHVQAANQEDEAITWHWPAFEFTLDPSPSRRSIVAPSSRCRCSSNGGKPSRHWRTACPYNPNRTEARSFECNICGQKFNRKDNLTRHLRNRHNTESEPEKPTPTPPA